MKVCGIVAEYNPFHNGHLYQLNKAREISGADAIVAVMSGNFLQRGEPAFMDKWTRAAMAVRAGVDLVIELPTYYATASAEDFAFGSVKILSDLGVDTLCFGSESGDIEALTKVATTINQDSPAYRQILHAQLDLGQSYHKAREMAVASVIGTEIEYTANDILGIEYIRALQRLNSKTKAVAIKRIKSDYLEADIHSDIASATAVRHLFKQRQIDWEMLKNVVPPSSYQTIYDYPRYVFLDDFRLFYNSIALREGKEGLRQIRDVKEGLENRIYDALGNVMSLDDYVEQVNTKRYTATRIQRIIINTILGIKADFKPEALAYLDYGRILGFNKVGSKLIRYYKKNSDVYLLTNLARDLKKYRKKNLLITLDIAATGIYSQVNHAVNIKSDYRRKPFRMDDLSLKK